MRILLVSEDIPHPNMGGLAKHVLTLAKALINAGHEVDLLGGNQYSIDVAGEEGQFVGRFFGELHGHLAGWKESKIGAYLPFKRPWIAQKMAQCIMSHAADYDVIHYHGHFPNIAKYIPQHINFVQTRHDQGSDCLQHTRFRDGEICNRLNSADCADCMSSQPNVLQRTISKITVNKYRRDVAEAFKRHKTIFVSDMLIKNFTRIAGPGEWGVVVNNFADLKKIQTALQAQLASKNANKQSLQLFVAGKLNPLKGIDVLLQTLVPIMPEHMHLIIAGDGPDEAKLRKQFKNERVIFLGWCDHLTVLNHAAASDIIIVPSLCEEAFGSTTLEGLLLGKPTFALARGATPELKKYQYYQGQLHLHSDMRALVSELIHFKPENHEIPEMDDRVNVDNIVPRLIDIYHTPPRATIL